METNESLQNLTRAPGLKNKLLGLLVYPQSCNHNRYIVGEYRVDPHLKVGTPTHLSTQQLRRLPNHIVTKCGSCHGNE